MAVQKDEADPHGRHAEGGCRSPRSARRSSKEVLEIGKEKRKLIKAIRPQQQKSYGHAKRRVTEKLIVFEMVEQPKGRRGQE